jgi:hypothetical protein
VAFLLNKKTTKYMSNFKKLRGRRILLSKPHKEKSGIELTAAQQAEIDADLMKKWTNLEVFATGEDVTEVVVGDKVYIPTIVLQNAEIIEMPDAGIKIMVGEQDVAIIW